MTSEEQGLVVDLRRVRFPVASFDKRFARNMMSRLAYTPGRPLTDLQVRSLRILHHRYRRQHGNHRCGLFCRLNELAGSLS